MAADPLRGVDLRNKARDLMDFLSPPKDLGPSNGRVKEPVLRRGKVLKMTPVSRVQ